MKMFLVATILVLQSIYLVAGDFSDPRWVALREKCVATTGMDEAHIHNAKKGDFTTDESFKMYLKCLLDEENLWHGADGDKVNVDALISILPDVLKPVFETPIRECIEEVQHDPEQHELAFKLAKCVHSKTLDKFDMP